MHCRKIGWQKSTKEIHTASVPEMNLSHNKLLLTDFCQHIPDGHLHLPRENTPTSESHTYTRRETYGFTVEALPCVRLPDTQSPSRTNAAWQAGACVAELAGWKQTSPCPEARLYPTGSWSVSRDTQDEGGRGGAAANTHHQLELTANGSEPESIGDLMTKVKLPEWWSGLVNTTS